MPSENGWSPSWVGQDRLEWASIPGTNPVVRLQIQKGNPLWIMRAFAADYNEYIEPLRDADSASYTPTNSVSTSNHLNGTAMDLNWSTHPFKVNYAGFDKAMIARARELLEFYEDTIFWAQDWQYPKDTMHWQMHYGTFDDQDRLADFVSRKIRPDGFSTFKARKPSETQKPLDFGFAASVLADATGLSVDRAREILPTVQSGLFLSECTNPNRIAMWLAQIGHESAGFRYTEEIASGAAYEGRTDLGNVWDGDGVRFKGRSWIQITGRHNYTEFSKWCFGINLVPVATEFVDNPNKLADLKWAGVGAAWYWTVARSTINQFADALDVFAVTRLINGGTNGISDRRARYDRARNVGGKLLQILETAAVEELDDEWEALMASTDKSPSRSIYRTSDDATMTARDAVFGADATAHMTWVESSAVRGEVWAIELVAKLAQGDLPAGKDDWAVEKARTIIGIIRANIAAQIGAK